MSERTEAPVRRARSLSDKGDSPFRRIARTSVADHVAEELLQLIALRRLGPDEFLPGERQLARLMGVSRASVRGALEQLKRRGLVTATRGGGTRLRDATGDAAPIDPERPVTDLPIALAGRLLAGAARDATARPDSPAGAALRRALQGLLVPIIPAGETARDEVALYDAVIEASGSDVFADLFQLLRQPLRAWLATAAATAVPPTLWRSLASALEAGDGAAAAATLQRRFAPADGAPTAASERAAAVRQAAE
jgi:GntR family transcriptional regulator, transcriptional repressor for pyruvate dehydrogenase complex